MENAHYVAIIDTNQLSDQKPPASLGITGPMCAVCETNAFPEFRTETNPKKLFQKVFARIQLHYNDRDIVINTYVLDELVSMWLGTDKLMLIHLLSKNSRGCSIPFGKSLLNTPVLITSWELKPFRNGLKVIELIRDIFMGSENHMTDPHIPAPVSLAELMKRHGHAE